MSTSFSTQETDATIRAAAVLMARCNSLWRDEHDRNEGWHTDYAVDVDVITLFMAPTDMSQYASVFAADEETGTQELLARMLGEFILRDLSGVGAGKSNHGSLLLISPHDEELERMTLALAAKVIEQTDTAKKMIAEIVDQIADRQPRDRHDFLIHVVENARDLIEAFDGQSGPRREMNRFGSLPSKRIRNLVRFEPYHAASHATTNGAPTESTLPPQGDVASPQRDEFVTLVGEWRARLRKHQTRRQPDYALFGDAIVMATLQWTNKHLAKRKRRLVLITGSNNLFDSAEEMITAKGSNFANDYLRHPLGFVAEREFFSPPKNEHDGKAVSFRLSDWLNLFFPAVLKKNQGFGITVDTKILKSIANGHNKDLNHAVTILARNENKNRGVAAFPKDMLDEWASVIGSTAALRGFTNSEEKWHERVKQFVDAVNSRLEQGWTIDEFKSELDSLAKKSLSNLYWSTSRFGVLTESKAMVRGLPALRFDSPYLKAQGISARLIAGVFKNTAALDVEQLYDDLRDMDSSNYHAHVIHALAFAGKGHWFATRTLCILALNVVDELVPEIRNYRDGREAAYLLAVTERRLACGESDIHKKAIPALEEARKRENVGSKLPEDVRFRSEAFAQEVILIQFAIFSLKNHPKINLKKQLTAAENIIFDAASRYETDRLGEVKNWVIRQTATNCLVLAVLSRHLAPESVTASVEIEKVRRLIHEIHVNGLGPESETAKDVGKAFCDTLSDFVYWVATALFDASAQKQATAREKVGHTTSLGASQLPFELDRLRLFKSLVAVSAR